MFISPYVLKRLVKAGCKKTLLDVIIMIPVKECGNDFTTVAALVKPISLLIIIPKIYINNSKTYQVKIFALMTQHG